MGMECEGRRKEVDLREQANSWAFQPFTRTSEQNSEQTSAIAGQHKKVGKGEGHTVRSPQG